MRIALFGKTTPDKSARTETQICEVCETIDRHGSSVYIPESLFLSFSPENRERIRSFALLFDVLPPVDFVFSVGGDGTFLRTAAVVGKSGIPIIGINTGRLGFLADVNLTDLKEVLGEISDKDFNIEHRSLLETIIDNKTAIPNALNEVAIMKQDTASMLSIHAYINDTFLTSYQADGLVIATPTGSTAYSLSAGGPILAPSSPSIILSPIAPHSLTSRPLVIDDSSRLRFRVESRSNSFLVSMDGQSQILHKETEIGVRKADYTLLILKRKKGSFFDTLRDKLMWGVDVRK